MEFPDIGRDIQCWLKRLPALLVSYWLAGCLMAILVSYWLKVTIDELSSFPSMSWLPFRHCPEDLDYSFFGHTLKGLEGIVSRD